MADHIDIEWVKALAEARGAIPASLNPIRGCGRETDACRNCYAAAIAYRFKGPWEGLAELDQHGVPRFNGQVRFVPQILQVALRAKKPRVYFVCDMADLFHPAMPDEWIDQVFAMIALCPQHLFLLLTKRPARMRAYIERVAAGIPERHGVPVRSHMPGLSAQAAIEGHPTGSRPWTWPLANVWVGASVHDQASANAFVPEVLATPATMRFLSMEPMLGPVDIRWALSPNPLDIAAGFLRRGHFSPGLETLRPLDWIITGGESGPKARPRHPDWARSIRDQCAAAGTPFFEKQIGEWEPFYDRDHDDQDWRAVPKEVPGKVCRLNLAGGLGFHGERVVYFRRVGKKKAGRLLDGVEHNGIPAAARLEEPQHG